MKSIIPPILLAALAIVSLPSHATTNGVVEFKGNILGNTCTIAVNGAIAPAVATVNMLPARDSDLNATGKTANITPFDISLTKCVGGTTAYAYFEAGSNTDASGRVKNTGTATNVSLELVDSDKANAAILTNSSQAATQRKAIVNGNATLKYGVRYYALGKATTGTVRGAVTYNVIYE